MKTKIAAVIMGMLLWPSLAGAAVSGQTGGIETGLVIPGTENYDFLKQEVGGVDQKEALTGDAKDAIIYWTNFAVLFVSMIAMVFLIYAGWLYLTAYGDKEKAKEGAGIIWKVIVGFMIILGAYAIINTVVENLPNEGTLVIDN